jgi:hypothetical protein
MAVFLRWGVKPRSLFIAAATLFFIVSAAGSAILQPQRVTRNPDGEPLADVQITRAQRGWSKRSYHDKLGHGGFCVAAVLPEEIRSDGEGGGFASSSPTNVSDNPSVPIAVPLASTTNRTLVSVADFQAVHPVLCERLEGHR